MFFSKIPAFIFIPSFLNLISCSVSILSQNSGSSARLYVVFIFSNPASLKYSKLSLKSSSSSVLKYIFPPSFKNCLYFSNCLMCVSLLFLCLGFGQGLQKLIYILSILSVLSTMLLISSISYLVSNMFFISLSPNDSPYVSICHT